ncbi:uncharacterized protein [Nicotiana sylvestris]|uniref:uncharacterized protein n=1 Tax=Nicotiana sylvestris TaxID=4096 RepID=UPI00388C9D9A
MKDVESIQDMHTRFTSIINELHSLGDVIPRNKLVRKILSVLPGSWESQVNAITKAKDLPTQTMNELIDNLKTYEIKRKKDNERREPKKEKNLVLKAESSDSSDDDSDMAYLTKRFQKMVRRNGSIPKRGSSTKRNLVPDKRFNRKSAADNIVKQALVAWGDSSSESEREPDAENISVMAVETEATKYDSLFTLMAQSDEDEEDEDDEETIEGLSNEKHTLEEKISTTEQERDDFLVIITDLEEAIEGLNKEHRTQLQAELERVKIDLEKSLKWTWSSDAVTAMYLNNSGNRQGIGFQRKKTPYNPHSKYVTIPDNWLKGMYPLKTKGYILSAGKAGKSLCHSIENMHYVDGLKYSLLSVSQIYYKGNKVEFLSKVCTITNLVIVKVVLVAKRNKNIYVADFESLQAGDMRCLKSVDNDAELRHVRLGHVSFSLLNKLIHKDLVRRLSNSRFTWTLVLRTKDETFEIFRGLCQEDPSEDKIEAPRTLQQNGVAERKNRTLEDMTWTMLVDNGIAKNFWVKAINTAFYLVILWTGKALLEWFTCHDHVSSLRAQGSKTQWLRQQLKQNV